MKWRGSPPRKTVIAVGVAGAAAGMALLAPILGAARALPPLAAFGQFGLGAAAGAIVGVASIVWFVRAPHHSLSRRRYAIAAGVGLAVAGLGLALLAPGFAVPRINDISTDLKDPPSLDVPGIASADRDLTYPAEFVEKQRAGYPDLDSLPVSMSVASAVDRSKQVAESLGWKVVHVDAKTGTVAATVTSTWFGFVDDVVVRASKADKGAVIDVRSKSRVGRGDFGANAKRIRKFYKEFNAGK